LQRVRDPRFGEANGEYSADHFLKNYDFLSQVRQGELATVKESLARAKKLLASSPAALREERQMEVDVGTPFNATRDCMTDYSRS
jgi:ribosomal RNA-processing protein 36